MWQPPLTKHLYGNTTTANPYSDDTQQRQKQQDELAANLMHLQKLHLNDLMPPLTTTSPFYATPNMNTNSFLPNLAGLPATTLTPALINHLQQFIRSRISGGSCDNVGSVSNRTTTESTTITPSANQHLLLSTAADSSSTSTFLTRPPELLLPPPPPAAATVADLPASTVLNMSLEIFTEALLRLNRLPHRLAQSLPQLLATNNSNTITPPAASVDEYLTGSSNRTALLLSPPPPPPPPQHFTPTIATFPLTNTNMQQSSPHLNIFKQYLPFEQQQLLLNLNNNANNITPTTTTTSYTLASSPIANGYYSASMNVNHLTATSSTICRPSPRLSSSSSSSTFLSSAMQDQQHRALRKRRDDLIDLFKKPYALANNSRDTIEERISAGDKITDKTDDLLLPPPKKKWIRHYLKANNHHHHLHHQLHVQNHNSNNNNNNSMMVDDIPPTSNQHSPPRHVSSSLGSSTGGSHYMQMLSTASGGGQQQTTVGTASISNHVTHATPRRRTISSTSNGAGTREVHNKLEKNRRAHLKECYEQLKNELSLKDEDRRKTSNLAILGEALKCVQYLNNRNQEVDAEWEHLANEKINLQKRFVSLKRELGPKYEQIFSGIFPDNEIGSIPNEREHINDTTHSLASGRGNALYSSSSSLSSGGSSSSNGGSGNNTMSSPVGAGLQTAMPTTISPVINKINNNNVNTTTSPISISNNNVVIQQQQQQRKNPINTTTTMQAVAIPATHHQGNSGVVNISSPSAAGSPTALITFGSSLPLSLTAKNISATAVTRGSPTPSTPSPSPSSSSGVSSSSSLISSSPPINGVINNGRNVTVNIPNGLKLHATAAGPTNTGTTTILATSAPAQGVNNTNNAIMLQALRGCHLV